MSKVLMVVDNSETMRLIIMKIAPVSGLDFDRIEQASDGKGADGFLPKPIIPETFKKFL